MVFIKNVIKEKEFCSYINRLQFLLKKNWGDFVKPINYEKIEI